MSDTLPTYQEIAARWRALRASGWSVREVACVGAPRTLLCAEFGDVHADVVHVCAGVHGDEPAGPLALLRFAESGGMASTPLAIRAWPLLNPSGFARCSRENAEGIDINRTFARAGASPESAAVIIANRNRRFAAAVDLHEDDEREGYYAYEYGAHELAAIAVDAARGSGITLESEAVISPNPDDEVAAIGGFSLSLRFARGAAARVLTLESPAGRALETRIAAHHAALAAIFAAIPSLS